MRVRALALPVLAGTAAAACTGSTFEMDGHVTLTVGELWSTTDHCTKYRRSHPELGAGTVVRVSDAAGKLLTVGALDAGSDPNPKTYSGQCIYPFKVPGVPSGEGPYQVAIDGVSGNVAVQEKDAQNVGMTIGGSDS